MPIALSAQPRQGRVGFRYADLDQFADAFSRSAPLFPIAHANTPSEPRIQFNGIVVIHCDSEVVHPPLSVEPKLLVSAPHGDAPTATRKPSQFSLEAVEGFLRDREPFSGEGKPKERTFLSLHHFAFVPVDLHLEDFPNPNVYYEFGISHAMDKNVVLCTKNIGQIPFDTSVVRPTLLYINAGASKVPAKGHKWLSLRLVRNPSEGFQTIIRKEI